MPLTVSKSWQFQAAHANPAHPGDCRRVHGHTYTIRVWARGPMKATGPETGMVVDFRRLSDAVKKHVIEPCDHRFLNELDLGSIVINDADAPAPGRGVLLDVANATTVEVLAGTFLARIRQDVPEVFRVRLYEGSNAYAEVEL